MDKKTRMEAGLLILIVLVIFSAKIHGQFLADDFTFLLKAKDFAWSITELLHIGFFGRWFRPIPIVTWMVLYKLFGLNPLYYHAIILMFHIINTLLVYWIAKRTIKENGAFISAALFAVLTAHLEAIHWVSCLFDILCALFFLTSFLGLIYFLETKKRLFYIVSLLSFVLSLLSKESAIAFPAVSLGYAIFWLFRKEHKVKTIALTFAVSLPYIAISIGYIAIRTRFLGSFGVSTPPLLSLFNIKLLTGYFYLFCDFLVPFYKNAGLWKLSSLAVAVFSIFLAVCFHFKKNTRKTIALGLLWIFATAFLTTPMRGGTFFASRWHYLPSIGFCLLMGQLLMSLAAFRLKTVLAYAIIAFYSISTIYHNLYWIEAWNESERIQRAFQENVDPHLEKPASAYFFNVPRLKNKIYVFFTGLPQCFLLLSGDRQNRFFLAREVVPPTVCSPEKTVWDRVIRNYYLFEWDTASDSFRSVIPVFRDSQASSPDHNIIYSWDFSKSRVFSQWQTANDLRMVFDKSNSSYVYLTTGPSSFLIDYFTGKRQIYLVSCYG